MGNSSTTYWKIVTPWLGYHSLVCEQRVYCVETSLMARILCLFGTVLMYKGDCLPHTDLHSFACTPMHSFCSETHRPTSAYRQNCTATINKQLPFQYKKLSSRNNDISHRGKENLVSSFSFYVRKNNETRISVGSNPWKQNVSTVHRTFVVLLSFHVYNTYRSVYGETGQLFIEAHSVCVSFK
jgi:hypothetical protein